MVNEDRRVRPQVLLLQPLQDLRATHGPSDLNQMSIFWETWAILAKNYKDGVKAPKRASGLPSKGLLRGAPRCTIHELGSTLSLSGWRGRRKCPQLFANQGSVSHGVCLELLSPRYRNRPCFGRHQGGWSKGIGRKM